jgi:hypothetical protein
MYTLFNSLDCELNAELKSDSELIDKVNLIRKLQTRRKKMKT